jgi:hypothetical protein
MTRRGPGGDEGCSCSPHSGGHGRRSRPTASSPRKRCSDEPGRSSRKTSPRIPSIATPKVAQPRELHRRGQPSLQTQRRWQDVNDGFSHRTAWRSVAENASRTLKKGMRTSYPASSSSAPSRSKATSAHGCRDPAHPCGAGPPVRYRRGSQVHGRGFEVVLGRPFGCVLGRGEAEAVAFSCKPPPERRGFTAMISRYAHSLSGWKATLSEKGWRQ